MWNAYSCAGLLAAVIINIGASRAAQGISAVMSTFGDLLIFESGGLPDPDFGRIMGTGLGFAFYTHSIYGGAGPGAFQMDRTIALRTALLSEQLPQHVRPEFSAPTMIRPSFTDSFAIYCSRS